MTRSTSGENRVASVYRQFLHRGWPGWLILATAVLIACTVALFHIDLLTPLYHHGVLWAAGLIHEYRTWCILPLILLLILPARLTFSRPGQAWRRTLLFFLFVAAVAAYLVYPFGLIFESPFIATLLIGTILFLLLNSSWVYLVPLYKRYRSQLVRYLDDEPHARSYLTILSAHHTQHDPQTALKNIFPKSDLPQQSHAIDDERFGIKPGLLTKRLRWFCDYLQKHDRIARVVGWFVPCIVDVLADHDRMLFQELEKRSRELWHDFQLALYGKTELPEMTAGQIDRAQKLFYRWLATVDAIAECHLFGVTPKSARSQHREHVRAAANLFANASRHCLEPTSRVLPDGKPIELWPNSEIALRYALKFCRMEIRCLDLLSGRPLRRIESLEREELLQIWKQLNSNQSNHFDRLLAVRYLSAQVVHDSLIRDLTGGKRPLKLTAQDWDVLDQTVTQSIRHITQRLSKRPSPDEEFAFTCRARFLDACLENKPPHVNLVDAHCRALRDGQSKTTKVKLARLLDSDAFVAAEIEEIRADSSTSGVDELCLGRALDHYAQSTRPSVRATAERWESRYPNMPRAIRAKLARVSEAATPPQSPEASTPDWRDWERPTLQYDPLQVRPNIFGRIPLMLLSVAATFVCAGVLFLLRNGPVIEAPDYRLADAQVPAAIQTVTRGGEAEPSLWVGTPHGVHIKAPGENFYWQHINTDNSELISNDVRRIAVGARRVAYLCAQNDRLGISLSGAPAAPPGRWPALNLADWQTLISTTQFGSFEDRNITTIRQPGGVPVVFFGTNGGKLGAYSVLDRQWLDLSELNSRIPEHTTTIRDMAFLKNGDGHIAAISTDNGLAWGGIGQLRSDNRKFTNWKTLGRAQLMTSAVPQIQLAATVGGPQIFYRSEQGGIAVIRADDSRHTTRIGQSGVSDLREDTIRRVEYSPYGRRLWMTHVPRGGNKAQVLVYRENQHEWETIALPANNNVVTEVTADGRDSNLLLVGTENGLLEVWDREGNDKIKHLGPDGHAIRRIAAGARTSGILVGVVPKNGSLPGRLLHWPSEKRTADNATTVIGNRRFPHRLNVSDLRTVEPISQSQQFYMGTRLGIALVDPRTREIFRPFPTAGGVDPQGAEFRNVRDLCVVPAGAHRIPKAGQPRGVQPKVRPGASGHILLRVTDDGVVYAIDTSNPMTWIPLLNDTSGSVDAKQLTAAKVFQEQLFLGSEENVSAYEMSRRRWTVYPSVPGLKEFFVADRALWAYGNRAGVRSLYLLSGVPGARQPLAADKPKQLPAQWKKVFEGVRTFDHSRSRIAVVTQEHHLKTADATGKVTAVVSSQPLAKPGKDQPKLACLYGKEIFLAPVTEGIGRYDLTTHQWTAIALPKIRDGVRQIHCNKAGLWLMDGSNRLFRNARDQDGALTTFEAAPVLENVASIEWGTDSALVLTKTGEVHEALRNGTRTLVGAAFDIDDAKRQRAVVDFGGKLLVAAEDRVGQYDLSDHSWKTSVPEKSSAVIQLVTTGKFAYALTRSGRLYRADDVDEIKWSAVNSSFVVTAPVDTLSVRIDGAPKRLRDLDAKDFVVAEVTTLGSALGVLVKGIGAFVVSDDKPQSPFWVRSQSLGLPSDAKVTCAAERNGDLFLGTRAHGIWSYQRLSADGRTLPRMWIPVVTSPKPEPIRKLVPPDNASEILGVLTDKSIVLLQRDKDGVWKAGKAINRLTPLDLTAARNGWHLTEIDDKQTIYLRHVNTEGVVTTLIGRPSPHRDATTLAVAFDANQNLLYRLDAKNRLAVYNSATHSWEDASVAGAVVSDVFLSNGRIWAWSPRTKQLFERKTGAWSEWKANKGSQPVQIVADRAGMIIRRESHQLEFRDGDRTQILLPPEARDFPGRWDKVTHLAEIGNWLFVAEADHGTFAYEQDTHRWRKVLEADKVVSEWIVAETDANGLPSSLYARTSDGKVSLLRPGKTSITVSPVSFAGEPDRTVKVKRIFRRDGVPCIWTDSDAIHALKGDSVVALPLLAPQNLSLANESVPPVRAAAEWQNRLFLAYGDGRQIAVYDPDRMRWQSIPLAAGKVLRFHQMTIGKSLRLFAELELGDAGKKKVSKAPLPPKGLVELRHDADKSSWSTHVIPGRLYDLADEKGKQLWGIGDDHRIQVLAWDADGDSGSWKPCAAEVGDSLPADIESAFNIGKEIIVLLKGGTVWRYSLDDLTWKQDLAEKTFSRMIAVAGQLFLLESKTDVVHRYDPGMHKWNALPKGGFGKTIILTPAKEASAPALWQLATRGGESVFSWRPEALQNKTKKVQAKFAEVRFEARRFDFNRYARIELRDGVLWAETLAGRDGQRVIRRFQMKSGLFDHEVVIGGKRFSDLKLASENLSEDSSLNVNGTRFLLATTPAEGGKAKKDRIPPWPGINTADGKQQLCKLSLKGLGLNGEKTVPVAPVRIGKQLMLNIDRWDRITALGGKLVASTLAGPMTLQLTDNQRITRRELLQTDPSDAIAESAGGVLVRIPGKPPTYYRVDGEKEKWTRLNDGKEAEQAAQTIADAQTLLKSNPLLRGWKTVRTDQDKLQLQHSSKPKAPFTPVSLGRDGVNGFGFDNALAVELTPEFIRLYTPDGRISYPRKPKEVPSLTTEPRLGVTGIALGRAVTRGKDEPPVIVGVQAGEQSVLQYDDGKWTKLEGKELTTKLAELRNPLLNSDGWKWNADDTVILSGGPFDKKPAAGRFDSKAGRFSFNAVRAHQNIGEDLWLMTDAGLLQWTMQKWTALPIENPAAEGGMGTARFLQLLPANDRKWTLNWTRDGKTVQYALDPATRTWKQQDLRDLVDKAQDWLLHADFWRLRRDNANPTKANPYRLLEITSGEAGSKSIDIRIPSDTRLLEVDDVTAIAGTAGAPIVGTKVGGLRWMRLDQNDATKWEWTPVRAPVDRMLTVADKLHVVHPDNKETLYDLKTLKPLGPPKQAERYSAQISRLLENERWKWKTTDAAVAIEFRFEPKSEWKTVTFGNGRFDFDRVSAMSHTGNRIAMATRHGVWTRRPTDGSILRKPAGDWTETAREMTPITLYWKSQRRKFAEIPGVGLLQYSGDAAKKEGTWKKLAAKEADLVRKEAKSQTARNGVWNVQNNSGALSYGVKIADRDEQPVIYAPELGGFTCDIFQGILMTDRDDSFDLLVATKGGLCTFGSDGTFLALQSDLTGDGLPDNVVRLSRTRTGVVAEVKSKSGTQFFFKAVAKAPKGKKAADGDWQEIKADRARELIKQARKVVDDNPNAWGILRNPESNTGQDAFTFSWQGEPVIAATQKRIRFLHDQVRSLDWHAGELWVASAGGVSRLKLSAEGSAVTQPADKALWTNPFLSHVDGKQTAARLFSLRATGDALLAREWHDGMERVLRFDAAKKSWGQHKNVEPGFNILHEQPGLGRWRLRKPDEIEPEFAANAFKLPKNGVWQPFADGTLSFWNCDPAMQAEGEAIAFQKHWWIATAGGILRLDAAKREQHTLYASTLDGDAVTNVASINVDRKTGELLAVVQWQGKERVLKFNEKRDGWEVTERDYATRFQPVQTAWLDCRYNANRTIQLRFRSDRSDSPGLLDGQSFFQNGRFRFDVVRHFTHEKKLWLLTDVGILRLEPNGDIRHFAKPFNGHLNKLRRLVSFDGAPCVLAEGGLIWRHSNESWQTLRDDENTLLKRLTTVAHNPLLTVRHDLADHYRVVFEVGDLPEFNLNGTGPGILRNGVLGFDDLRDMHFRGDKLMLATRLGVWHYDLARESEQVIPVDADYYAKGPDRNVPPKELTNLKQFVPVFELNELLLVADDGKTGFRLKEKQWEIVNLPEAGRLNRIRRFSAGSRHLIVRLDDGQLSISQSEGANGETVVWEAPVGNEVVLLEDAFETPTSIWIPTNSRILWVRKSRL